MKDILVKCRACGELIENCECQPCEVCGQVGQPACVEHHGFVPHDSTISISLNDARLRVSKGAVK